MSRFSSAVSLYQRPHELVKKICSHEFIHRIVAGRLCSYTKANLPCEGDSEQSIRMQRRSLPSLKVFGSRKRYLISCHNVSSRAEWPKDRSCSPPQPQHQKSFPRQSVTTSFTIQRRGYLIETLPTALIPPVAFLGFFLSLWAYKCCMMILFQNKIIYMPFLSGGRHAKINDYTASLLGIAWHEKRMRSLDGTEIALCVGSVPPCNSDQTGTRGSENVSDRHTIILYFQGNGDSTPPRLPLLSKTLFGLAKHCDSHQQSTRYTVVALSYRGYWTSRGRPSQIGIEQDALAALQWIESTYPSRPLSIILWGQSLGAGVATACMNARLSQKGRKADDEHGTCLQIAGLQLETPFVSIRSMLTALYPQRWLPYRYLWPFLRSHWDSETALKEIATKLKGAEFPVGFIIAEKDELVPPSQAELLVKLCRDSRFRVSRTTVKGALHNEATTRGEGQRALREFVTELNHSKR